MTAAHLLDLHDELCGSAKALMTRKNHDYTSGSGDPFANFRGSSYLGIDPVLGVMLRMQDKMMRVRTFVEKGELKVKGESIKDALIDLINYTVLMYGIIEEGKVTPATEATNPPAPWPDDEGINVYLGDPVPLYSGASAREWLERQAAGGAGVAFNSSRVGGSG